LNSQAGERSVGLFAYPWDIADAGVASFVEGCVGLGVTEIHATTCYHSGKFLLPRNSRSRVYFPEPGCIYFQPSREAFRNSLTPPVSDIASTGWIDQLAGEAAKQGIRLAAWTVFFHNSMLGQMHPELTIRNLFGDPYKFALCPSHGRVQDYAVDLCKSIQATGAFAAIELESIGYRGYVHGYHHEVHAVPLGPLEKFILSLCFCEDCRVLATEAGIRVEALMKALQKILQQRFASDHACTKDPQNAEQISTLLALIPEMRAYVDFRGATISKLIARIRGECPRLELNVFTSSFVGSPSNIWMEGINFSSIRDLVDRAVLLAYSSDPEAVNTDLSFCLSLLEDPARINLALNLGLPATPALAGASQVVQFALEHGIQRFSFFNYGFLGEGRLQWVKDLSSRIRGHSSHDKRN
jgi:hypothetical protein